MVTENIVSLFEQLGLHGRKLNHLSSELILATNDVNLISQLECVVCNEMGDLNRLYTELRNQVIFMQLNQIADKLR